MDIFEHDACEWEITETRLKLPKPYTLKLGVQGLGFRTAGSASGAYGRKPGFREPAVALIALCDKFHWESV